MSLFVLHLHKVAAHLALCRGNRYLQIRHHQAYAVGSYVESQLRKWMFAQSEFDIRYQPAKAVKGQALADPITERINTNITTLSVQVWAMYFDESACEADVA
jgi:hypothetical protein